jgi:hypothetical protein
MQGCGCPVDVAKVGEATHSNGYLGDDGGLLTDFLISM